MLHAHHITSQPYGISLALLLTAGLYVRGWLRLRSSHQNRIPAWRAWSFLLGVWLIWVAVPMIAIARSTPTGVQAAIAPLLRLRSIQVLRNAITHPAVCWSAATV